MNRQAASKDRSASSARSAWHGGLLDRRHSFGTNACVQKEGESDRIQPDAAVARVLSSPGRPLDADTRAVVEPRFGRDFSTVRIHADETAGDSAQV